MTTHRRNLALYFYGYFVIQVIFVYINVFLPVYFFNILNVNRAELAIIQILSYSALFIKPVISLIFDKDYSLLMKKAIVLVIPIGIFLSFVWFILNLNSLAIFGVFFGINLACSSTLDVIIDKILITQSPDGKTKDKNAAFTQLGAIFGALFPPILSFFIFEDISSRSTWSLFFMVGIISIIPVIFIGFFLRNSIILFEKTGNEKNEERKRRPNKTVDRRNIYLLGTAIFLVWSERIYNYPMEPWVLNKYGEENLSLILLFFVIVIILNALGVALAGVMSHKFNRKKLLIVSEICYGSLMIIAPFMNMIGFFVLFGIMQIFSGFIVINIVSIMIKESQDQVTWFQILSCFAILASVIFVPLGTYLSAIIATEFIIVAAGIMQIMTIIPLYFLNIKIDEMSKNKE